MHLMGLTDEHRPIETDGSDWPCPVSVEELDLLIAASNHHFFPQLVQEGRADGYVHSDKIVSFLDALCNGERQQCDCVAHSKLRDLTTSEADLEDIKEPPQF